MKIKICPQSGKAKAVCPLCKELVEIDTYRTYGCCEKCEQQEKSIK